MKVLIVAKTRRGPGACVGGITAHGRSVRLVAGDPTNERAGLEYEVGDVWEIEGAEDHNIIPPHVENVIVLSAEKLRRSDKLEQTIRRFMPPVSGGPDELFEGLAQSTASGGLYIAERSGIPTRSTMFWIPDRPLLLDYEGKRIRYRYPTEDGGARLRSSGSRSLPRRFRRASCCASPWHTGGGPKTNRTRSCVVLYSCPGGLRGKGNRTQRG